MPCVDGVIPPPARWAKPRRSSTHYYIGHSIELCECVCVRVSTSARAARCVSRTSAGTLAAGVCSAVASVGTAVSVEEPPRGRDDLFTHRKCRCKRYDRRVREPVVHSTYPWVREGTYQSTIDWMGLTHATTYVIPVTRRFSIQPDSVGRFIAKISIDRSA